MDRPPSILSISYYQSLLQTRAWILSKLGLNVTSVSNFTEALAQCREGVFDLVIIGHVVPAQDRLALMTELRKHCHTPVLSLFRLGDPPIQEADYSLNSLEGPEKLIKIIKAVLKKKSAANDRRSKVKGKADSAA